MSKNLLQQLIDLGTNKVRHINQGLCPDEIEGHDTRDAECPACAILIEAATAVRAAGAQ